MGHFGATKEHIVETTVFVKGLRQYHSTTSAASTHEYFGQHWPTSNLSALPNWHSHPQLVEIVAARRSRSQMPRS